MAKQWPRSLAVSAAIGLVACGSEPKTTFRPPDDDPTPVDATVELVSWWTVGADAAGLQVLIDAYKRGAPGASVTNSGRDWLSAQATIAQRIAEPDAPDIVHALPRHLGGWLEYPGEPARNLLEPLDAVLDAATLDNFAPALRERSTHDGRVYALPLTYHRMTTMYYNQNLLAQHGQPVPRSYEEWKAVAAAMKAAGAPFAVSLDNHGIPYFLAFIAINVHGPEWAEALIQAKTPWTTELEMQLRQVLTEADDLLTHLVVAEGARTGNLPCDQALYQGLISMFIYPDWQKAFFVGKGWTPGVDFGIIAAPGTQDFFTYIADVLVVPTGARHRENALRFIASSSRPETLGELVALKQSNSPRLDIDETSLDPIARDALEHLRTARVQTTAETAAWDFYLSVAKDSMGPFIREHGRVEFIIRANAAISAMNSRWPEFLMRSH